MNTRAVVDEFFARSSANDLSVVDLFDDRTEFFAPGNPAHFPWAGVHRAGGAALAPVFEQIWASREPGLGRVESSTLIVSGDDAAWIGVGVSHQMNDTSRNPGERFSLDVAMHFRVRNGKIVRLWVIEDMTALAESYGYR